MICQKDKFSILPEITYLNCCYKAPQMKKMEEVGLEVIKRQGHPYTYSSQDFFTPVEAVKEAFSNLIEAEDPDRIAIIPSASYGLANVAKNLKLKKGDQIIVVEEQFPSNIYPWITEVSKVGATIDIISPPTSASNRGGGWNEAILEAITDQTKMVAISHVHWIDGTVFDLKAIREKTWAHQALLVIDGTQSVGALPFSVRDIQPDALICAAYKWLLGPYSIGLAYYGSYFDGGVPVEESWVNRLNSDDFSQLVNYQPFYRPKANRFCVGESANFILLPLLQTALDQLLEWKVANIQAYCRQISRAAIAEMRDMNLHIAEESTRSAHLFGVKLNENIDKLTLKQQLEQHKVMVSFRGDSLRVGPNVYNEAADLEKLVVCLKNSISTSY